MNNPRQDEFIQPQALTAPSTPYVPSYEDRLREEDINVGNPDDYQGQPSLNIQNPEEEYGEIYEAPIVEHESIPTFQMLPDNRDVAKPINFKNKDPYER